MILYTILAKQPRLLIRRGKCSIRDHILRSQEVEHDLVKILWPFQQKHMGGARSFNEMKLRSRNGIDKFPPDPRGCKSVLLSDHYKGVSLNIAHTVQSIMLDICASLPGKPIWGYWIRIACQHHKRIRDSLMIAQKI